LLLYQFFFQYRVIENEQLNFIETRKKATRKYNRLLKSLEKEKIDLQFQLDSEQKGIHARRDSDVILKIFLILFLFACWRVFCTWATSFDIKLYNFSKIQGSSEGNWGSTSKLFGFD
jgi:hypothetical protein